MPYIPREQRDPLDPEIQKLVEVIRQLPVTKQDGSVNYTLSMILIGVYGMKEEPTYYELNRAIGVLEAAKLEIYRRRFGPLEDAAASRNGDL